MGRVGVVGFGAGIADGGSDASAGPRLLRRGTRRYVAVDDASFWLLPSILEPSVLRLPGSRSSAYSNSSSYSAREVGRDAARELGRDVARNTASGDSSSRSPKAGDDAPVRDARDSGRSSERDSAREADRMCVRDGGRVDALSDRLCVRDGGRIDALSLRWCDRDGGRDVDTPRAARLAVVDDARREVCDEAVGGGARTDRDNAGASGDGIPGRCGRDRADFRSWPNAVRSNGEAGSLRRTRWPLATGVSSLSETKTQFVGENNPSLALSPANVVTVVDLDSCETRWCAADKVAEVAEGGNRLELPMVDPGAETSRFDTRVFSLSSVALMRAWRSCRSLNPFVFAVRVVPLLMLPAARTAVALAPLLMLLTTRAVPGEG